jgi:hypothetical protein
VARWNDDASVALIVERRSAKTQLSRPIKVGFLGNRRGVHPAGRCGRQI